MSITTSDTGENRREVYENKGDGSLAKHLYKRGVWGLHIHLGPRTGPPSMWKAFCNRVEAAV